jgi:hypothetical protein
LTSTTTTIELPWDAWRAVIAALREKALPYMLDHADQLEQQLDRHGPDQATARLSLADDACLEGENLIVVQFAPSPRQDSIDADPQGREFGVTISIFLE